MNNYPKELGVVKFKDGTYEVYPNSANVPPAVKYLRDDTNITPEQAQRTLDVLGYFECMCEDCKEVTPTIIKALEHFAGGQNEE